MSRGAARLALLVVGLLGGLLCWRLAGTPTIIVLAAALPALVYGGLVVRLARVEPAPVVLPVALFLWGAAAAAPLALAGNEAVHTWLAGRADATRAGALTASLAAPLLEELAKAAPLLLLFARRRERGAVLDGIRYGALTGIGFAMTENSAYFLLAAVQGGAAGLAQSVYLRAGLEGLNHAVFSATVGAALGWAVAQRGHRRWLVPLLGLVLAAAEHALWNTLAAGAIDALACNPAAPGGACRPPAAVYTLLVAAPAVVALCIGPPLLLLAVAVRWERGRRPSTTPN